MEAPGWPQQYDAFSEALTQAQAQAQQERHGIVVRNTFIDVCQPEDSASDCSPCMSPHKRNLSAPPSPARRRPSGHNDPWGKESDEEEEEDPGSIPHYHWPQQGRLLASLTPQEAPPHDSQLHQSSWPDQYIEDDPAYKLWNERSETGGIAPPGLLLPPGSPSREGKSGRKGRRGSGDRAGVTGLKGQPHRPALGSFLRAGELPDGSDTGFMQQGVDFGGFGNGYGPGASSGLEQSGLWQPGSGLSQESAEGTRSGLADRIPGLGLTQDLSQDLWSSAKGRWSDSQEAGDRLPPPPPFERPPSPKSREAPVFLLGTTHNGNQSSPILGSPSQQGASSGNKPQTRGLGTQRTVENVVQGRGADLYQSEGMAAFQIACGTSSGTSVAGAGSGQRPAIGPPPGNFAEGASRNAGGNRRPAGGPPGNFDGAMTQAQGGFLNPGGPFLSPYPDYGMPNPAGRGIAGGAGAVGPVVPDRGPFPGSPMGPAAGRGGRDPLAVGSTAPRPPAASLYEASPYSSSSMKGEDGAMGPLGYPTAPGGPAYSAGRGSFPMTTGHNFQPLGAHGPWVPEGVDISAAFAMSGGRGDGGGRGRGGGEAKNGNRMPLSGGGPKRTDYIKKYGQGRDDHGNQVQPITTMMLKNIPCRKSQEEVMAQIDKKGFGGRYDFFYLPRDVKFRANLGYAFINFVTPEDAAAFQQEMNGYRFVNSGSSKACVVVPAHVQGMMNNLAAFKRTEVMRSSRKPYFSGVVTL